MNRLYKMPGHLIRRAQQIAVAIFMDETSGFDITPVQFAVLTAVKRNPDIDATRLSSMIAFDRSTIGNVIERLESRGYLARFNGAEDKRIKFLRLEPSGEQLISEVDAAVVRAQERILEPLDKNERESFIRLLEKVTEINNSVSRAPLNLDVRRRVFAGE